MTSSTMSQPSDSNPRPAPQWLGWGLIIFASATAACFGVLSAVFDFPAVLRAPAAEVLPAFSEHSAIIRPTYWLLAMSGLALIAMAGELGRLFPEAAGRLITNLAIATGIFWAIGYIRWPIAVPYLADLYRSGQQEQAAGLYELSNRFAGMAVGEHLGFILMGGFAFALAVALRRARYGPKWLPAVGWFAGALLVLSSFEQYDPSVEILGAVNGAANTLWFLWLLAIGVVILRKNRALHPSR